MTNPDTSREAVERAAEELIEYLDQEAEIEIESAGHMTELGKQLRRLETTSRILDNERRALLAERDALKAELAVAVDALNNAFRSLVFPVSKKLNPRGWDLQPRESIWYGVKTIQCTLAALTADTPKEGKDDDQ